MKRFLFLIIALFIGLLLVSCGTNVETKSSTVISLKKVSTTTNSNPVKDSFDDNLESKITTTTDKSIESISLNCSSMNLTVGQTKYLSVSYNPFDAENQVVNWYTSNINVASVSSNGAVFANSVGAATITAKTFNGKETSCIVNVKSEVISLTLSNYEKYVEVEHQQLELDSSNNLPFETTVTLKDGCEITKTLEITAEFFGFYTHSYQAAGNGPAKRQQVQGKGYLKLEIKPGKRNAKTITNVKLGGFRISTGKWDVLDFRIYGTIEKTKAN